MAGLIRNARPRRGLSLVLAVAVLFFANPATVYAMVPGPTRTVYFQDDGEIYEVDFSSYRAHAAAYAAGEGSFSISVERVLFVESPLDRLLVSGHDRGSALAILGSEPRRIERMTGKDPRHAIGVQDVLDLTWSRSGGSMTTRIDAGEDRVELTVPEAFFDKLDPAPARLSVNGRVARIHAADLRRLAAFARGHVSADAFEAPAELVDLAAEFNDAARWSHAVLGFQLFLERLGTVLLDDSEDSDCWMECLVGCLLGAGGYAASWMVLIASGCGGVVGCLIWGAGHTAALTGATYGCATCIGCLDDPGDSVCPVECGPGIDCPEGCACPDGSPAGPSGCGDECDPEVDPDGCECPAGDCQPW